MENIYDSITHSAAYMPFPDVFLIIRVSIVDTDVHSVLYSDIKKVPHGKTNPVSYSFLTIS
ncbi:MAG: hypothetical protein JXA44_01275 [Methanospirillaceae archaeon]|nr:hypothetical protein [Methanospirillaceae archaeon]